MSAYIDETYIENALGAAVQTALASGTVLTQFIAAASDLVDSALEGAGYAAPLTGTVPNIVKMATLGAFLPLAYGREGLPVPAQYSLHTNIFEAIRKGEIQIPGLEPNADEGPGAAKFTGSSTTTDGDKPPIFGDLRKLY